MKTKKNIEQAGRFMPDAQKRLVAYTTAAGLGALFAGQKADAQVVESQVFAPYPATLPAPFGTNVNDFNMDIQGVGVTNFQIVVLGQKVLSSYYPSQWLDIIGEPVSTVGETNAFIDNPAHNYLVSWLGGMTVNSAGSPPEYMPRLAIDYYFLGEPHLNNKFPIRGTLGFEFVSAVDGQEHFGYMDAKVNSSTNVLSGENVITSMTVYDVYYNQTPNAGITIPFDVDVTNITVGAENAVTIDFSSNTNAPVSALSLETSPTLGPSANWTTDTNAIITQTSSAVPNSKMPQAFYQATTTATNTPAQFWRVMQTLSPPVD
ncbi:MAG TPA: hypothetical protein VMF08_05450 [Candidatus Sulfotelmatobacter sp.]|nr:hypothetical protein [Candidatus Sulfotelmatobacter sp.]